MFDLFCGSHANEHSFNGQQATGLQRIAFERHGQGEDEFDDQQPTGSKGIEIKGDRIDHQK